MPRRYPTLLSYEPQARAVAGLTGAGILRLTAVVTGWAAVGVVGAACVLTGVILFCAWGTAPLPRRVPRELAPLVPIACITAGGAMLVRFAFVMIQDVLHASRRGAVGPDDVGTPRSRTAD